MDSSSLSMQGKSAVVTGATAGIGLASTVALARAGALVIGVGRSPQRCAQAEAQIQHSVPGARVRYLVAELSLQREVRRLAEDIRGVLDEEGFTHLDALVNNAGTFSARLDRSDEGIYRALAVNHLAGFLLTNLLLPSLRAAPFGRVVTVSSASHYRAIFNPKRLNQSLFYNGLWAYKITKLMNVLFTYELNRRESGTSLRAFAVDPGLINTEIGLKDRSWVSRLVWDLRRRGGRPPEVPAQTVLYLCAEEGLQSATEVYWRDLAPKTPSRAARQPGLARDLWQASADLCGLDEINAKKEER
ncbi:MAG: SDR family NAD(P)-dependent oxidoreductase [Chloroflexi bacterium]|nr:SDR family NAD(P)-dependent oxidoreductase [Chloroflexota bacterium]